MTIKSKLEKNKVLLLILDGWGLNHDYEGNAITRAKTPNWDRIWQDYPTAVLQASGEAAGLPEGQMGNSEVGHFTIGAGHIFFQDLVRINKAIDDGSFSSNKAFVDAFEHVKKHDSTLHLMGLVSPGGVHSHQKHFTALIQAAKDSQVNKVSIHAFLDGRDTPPKSALEYVTELERDLTEIGLGKVASLSGRFYAMDRDKKWDRTDKFYQMVIGKKEAQEFSEANKAIQASYHDEISDEYLEPCLIGTDYDKQNIIQENDAVLLVNYRNDRMLQLTDRLLGGDTPSNVYIASMSTYSSKFHIPVAFTKDKPTTYLGKVISDAGLKQLRVTETEKSAHMTFFFNCQEEEALEGEDRIILDSHNVKSHAERPEMRAEDITSQIEQDMAASNYSVILSNICNGDMVGHTGDIPAAIKACQTIDKCLFRLEKVALEHNWQMIIIADHGNIDEMKDEETGEVKTCHSLSPVPFVVISDQVKELTRHEGGLRDVAPTIIKLLDLDKPQQMGGESLV